MIEKIQFVKIVNIEETMPPARQFVGFFFRLAMKFVSFMFLVKYASYPKVTLCVPVLT